MSLILKGIDLPTNGETLIVGICGDGYVSVEHSKPLVLAIDPTIEAIQIPKGHGRLIDGDKLNKSVHMWNPAYTYGRSAFTREINNAPTILGAEGAE